MQTSDHNASAHEAFAWTAYPARERPLRTLLGAFIIAVFGAVVGWLCVLDGMSPRWAAITGTAASAILILALHRFFLPSRFEIDSEGLTARYFLRTQRACWRDIRRFLHDEFGGYLSTRSRRSRLDAWKGLHILFGEERERIINSVRAHLNERERHRAPAEVAGGSRS